jgi:cytochrome c-type biogenesis protein CcmH/NrfF
MDQSTQLLLLIVAAVIGAVAALLIIRRQRIEQADTERESPYAASTEGEKRCPKCGMGNLWTSRNCISCQARLPG